MINTPLHIVTIVLDGMPQIRWHLPAFNRLRGLKWTWHIAEGAAANVRDTSWCKAQAARLSRDGTSEYLNALAIHPRIKLYRKQLWNGKTEMFNTMLANINEPCILLQMDADEVWTEKELAALVEMFEARKDADHARFYCTYYVGQNIIITSKDTYGNKAEEWLRAWRFTPGMKFETHEPPRLIGAESRGVDRDFTAASGMVFEHYAYAFEAQVAYKEKFYGYPNALAHWRRLQQNTKWPTRLRDWLPWVKDNAIADQLWKTSV